MLNDLLGRTLVDDPNRPVLDFAGTTYSAVDLEEGSNRLASSLKLLGCESIERIGILLPNCPEAVSVYLACFKAGFVAVPLDFRHKSPQIRYALHHSGASVLIVHEERLETLSRAGCLAGLRHVIVVGKDQSHSHKTFDKVLSFGSTGEITYDMHRDDLCVMIYTSGTTSRPKGVTLTRDAIVSGIKKYLVRVPLDQNDVALIAAPITRPMALRCQLLPMLYVGGRISLLPTFEVNEYIRALLAAPAKSFLSLLPSGLAKVVDHDEFSKCDFGSLKLCICGGDRTPMGLHQRFHDKTGLEITEQCGASEAGPYSLNPPFGRKKPGSIGLPMYGTLVCIVNEHGEDVGVSEVGEIIIKSPMMMDGYWNDTALSRKAIRDGWYYTGDLGTYDEDGYLWFMGRKKDIIICGGSNVSPHEIESVLLQHPLVSQACVFGLFDDKSGQTVHGVVVLNRGDELEDSEVLREFCREHLADYMVPNSIRVIENMPLKGPGKIDRDLVRIQTEIRPLVEKVPFFQNVTEVFIKELVHHLSCKEFEADDWILRQGEIGNSMYFLTRGKVDVVADPSEELLATLAEGSYFGELAILKDSPRAASVRAVDSCEVFELKRDGVIELSSKYPDFRKLLNEAMANY